MTDIREDLDGWSVGEFEDGVCCTFGPTVTEPHIGPKSEVTSEWHLLTDVRVVLAIDSAESVGSHLVLTWLCNDHKGPITYLRCVCTI